jgi:hypothetical protein
MYVFVCVCVGNVKGLHACLSVHMSSKCSECVHIHVLTYTQTHTRMHTCTHTHTHAYYAAIARLGEAASAQGLQGSLWQLRASVGAGPAIVVAQVGGWGLGVGGWGLGVGGWGWGVGGVGFRV